MSHAAASCMQAECSRMPWCPIRLQHRCVLSLALRYTLTHPCQFPCITIMSQDHACCMAFAMLGYQRPQIPQGSGHCIREASESAHFEKVCIALQVSGLSNMIAGLQASPLHRMHAFSSISADVGNAGQSNYAAANAAISAMMQTAAQQVSR